MTSVWLLPAQPGQPGALLRFLDFGLHSSSAAKDDRAASEPSVVPCAIEAHHNDSTLTMTFVHFGNGSVLVYDPGTYDTSDPHTAQH
jgi:hypothetical protein